MSFHIKKTSSDKSITKSEFLNSELVKSLDDKHKQKLESIFDKFNTNKSQYGEEEVLDKEEQAFIVDWFQKIAGKNDKVTRREFRRGKKKDETEDFYIDKAKIKDYEKFMKAFVEAAVKSSLRIEEKPEIIVIHQPTEITEEEVVTQTEEPSKEDLVDAEYEDVKEEEIFELPTKPSVIQKVSQPKVWQKAYPSEAMENISVEEDFTADEVLATLMETYNIKPEDVQMDKLTADLIKYNPSIFNSDGMVYADVEWKNLDFPKNAGELYKNGVQTPVVEKSRKVAPVKKAGEVEKAEEVVETAEEYKPNYLPICALPQNVTPPKKGANFNMWIGIDLSTGANLNRRPFANVELEINNSKSNEYRYKQTIDKKTYYYNEHKVLTSVEDKENHKNYYFSYKSNSELAYVSEGGPNYYVYRDAQGDVFKYVTYEDCGTVIRDKNGKFVKFTVTEQDTQGNTYEVTRNTNGDVIKCEKI